MRSFAFSPPKRPELPKNRIVPTIPTVPNFFKPERSSTVVLFRRVHVLSYGYKHPHRFARNPMASSSSSSSGFSNGAANSWVVAQRVRHASHAGSWYSDGAKELDRQLGEWLERVGPPQGAARAIISPHAGYSYCGETAAYAFKQVDPDRVKRIFVLGPSHIVFLNGCALTTCAKYRTPLRDLVVDVQVNSELVATDAFEPMSLRNEEAEHSLEMQMPFVAKLMGDRHFTIVPVLVGSLSVKRQQAYGKIFAHYLADPQNLFVISSDFCHWGSRFHYQPHSATSAKPIHEQIALLDQRAMEAIAAMDPPIFNEYLKETQNTICGRNPICVMLQAAEYFRQMNNHTADLRFLKYSQSNKCRSVHESSVSYAAGALFVQPK
ncbi:MEMO1 family protein [Aphelenchoides fujianensis]|nr:MEMO1 family protein [Aphelenchoides fujianensis]